MPLGPAQRKSGWLVWCELPAFSLSRTRYAALMSRLAVLLALMVLTACGKADNASDPGGASIDEARALDEAAEMIEVQRLPLEANPPVGQSGPAVPLATPPGQADKASKPDKTRS